MKAYQDLLRSILSQGNYRGDRTGTGTQSCFGLQFKHDLNLGFPLLTTKRLPFKTIVTELMWFLQGNTNIRWLLERNVHIWSADAHRMFKRANPDSTYTVQDFEKVILEDDEFARTWGDLGPIYGQQWRSWPALSIANSIDQLGGVIESIQADPEGRRHIVTAWNPNSLDEMALPPCHCLFQFYVHDGRLSCHLYQRSADVFLGVPFNIASYALLTHIVAHTCRLGVGDLIISFGDVHIYNNHRNQVALQLSRNPLVLPILVVYGPQGKGLASWLQAYAAGKSVNMVELSGYVAHDAIEAELSVGT